MTKLAYVIFMPLAALLGIAWGAGLALLGIAPIIIVLMALGFIH